MWSKYFLILKIDHSNHNQQYIFKNLIFSYLSPSNTLGLISNILVGHDQYNHKTPNDTLSVVDLILFLHK